MPECYIGRGRLYARRLDVSSSGFHLINGESEVSLEFTEDTGYVFDSRYGRRERVDAFPRSILATLKCDIFDMSETNLKLLLKGASASVPGGAKSYVFPSPVQAGCVYPLAGVGSVSSVVITSFTGVVLTPNLHYRLDASVGLVEFLGPPALVEPYTATYTSIGYTEVGLASESIIPVALLFKGVNSKTRKAVQAEFYRGELAIADSFPLVSKEFAKAPFKCELLADFTHHADAIFSHYGKVIKL